MREEATDCPQPVAAGSSWLPHRPPAKTQPIRGVREASEPIRGDHGTPEPPEERGASAPFRGGNGASVETYLREKGERGQSRRRSRGKRPCWEEEENGLQWGALRGPPVGEPPGANPYRRRCPHLTKGTGCPMLRGRRTKKQGGNGAGREAGVFFLRVCLFGFIFL